MNTTQQLELAIQALQSQRALLGDTAVDAAIAALQAQIALKESDSNQSLQLRGERKLVTIMFADISGFTAFSEKNDPEIVRALMNACFDCLVPVLNEHEGTIDKFIGDEIMALFGAPKAHERHAELACNAALEMFKSLEQFNLKHGTNLGLHIGINTGLVIAGGIGSEGRQEYSVMGDAVNLAARLKDAATHGEVFVGSEVQALTNHQFNFNALPPLRIKGKTELVRTWRLESRKIQPGVHREGALRSNLIGRETELQALSSLFFDLKKDKGSRISIIGEAGIGKSRLVTELQNQVENDLTWVEGRSLSYTRQRAYQPAFEIMTKLLGSSPTTTETQLKILLQEELERTLGFDGKNCLPFLCRMMQLPLSEEEDIAVRYLSGNVLREKIFIALSTYLAAKAQHKPLVLVWEDLHWADPSSLALIEDLMDLDEACPIAILLMFRPQKEEKIWQLHEQNLGKYGSQYHTFSLEPLTITDCATLARNLMYVENIAPEVEKIVMEKAEGNPFFMEELLRSLLDNGMLYLEGQMIKAAEGLDTLVIPGTLQGVIASRIDQLEETDKHILQIASILGRIFREAVLEALLTVARKGSTSLPPSLQKLVERELLRNRPNEELELAGYIFKHAVTHDVAYNSLLLSDRKLLHRLAGETIEKMADGNQDDYAETLAYHYERADQAEKAVHFLGLAAERAKRLHFNEEAIELYQRAIKQAENLLQREGEASNWRGALSELLENQADIQRLMGQANNARTTYSAAIEQVDVKNRISRSRLLRKTGMCLQVASQFQVIFDYFKQAQQVLEQEQSDHTAAWWHEWLEVMNERMFLYYWVNQAEAMQQLAGELEHYLPNATPAQRSRYYSNLVLLDFRVERYLLGEKTIVLAKKAVDAFIEPSDLSLLAYAKFILGFTHLWCNQMEESISLLQSSLELAEKTGDIVIKTRNLTYLAVANRRIGNLKETEFYTLKCIEVAELANMQEYLGTSTANLAWIAWKKKDIGQMTFLGKKAYDHWNKVPQNHSSLVFVWTLAFPLAAMYAQVGDLPKCVEQFESLLQADRKKFEPELESAIVSVVNKYKSPPAGSLVQEDIQKVLALAERYQYL